MYLKRFIELLVVYSFSFSLAIILTGIKTSLLRLFIGILIGYLVLVIPLTILTIKKMKKRNAVSGSNLKNKNRFQTVLDALPAFVYLATQDGNKVISNSIVTYSQSKEEENLLYIVTNNDTKRVSNIKLNNQVAIASLYDDKTGLRFSSNDITAFATTNVKEVNQLVVNNPQIKNLSENIENQTIITLRLNTVLIESFRTAPEVIDFH